MSFRKFGTGQVISSTDVPQSLTDPDEEDQQRATADERREDDVEQENAEQ